MIQLFGMKQLGYPAQIGFDREALIPTSTLTQFDVARRRILFSQALVGQRNRLAVVPDRQRPKDVITLVSRVPRPIDDFTLVIDQPGQLDADDPAPVRLAFLADLSLAA